RHLLQPAADRADLLPAIFAFTFHVVDVVYDDQAEPMLDLEPPSAGPDLRYPGRRVVEEQRRRVDASSRVSKPLVLVILDLAVSQPAQVDHRLERQEPDRVLD